MALRPRKLSRGPDQAEIVSDLGEADLRDPRDADRLSRSLGEIDDAAVGVGTAVIDAHHDRAAGALIHDPDLRPERKGPVCRGQGIGVESLTARGAPSMEARPI